MNNKCPFEFDLMNPMTYNQAMPLEAFRTLREQCPVSEQSDSNRGGKFWAITRQQDIDYVSKNPAIFSSRENLAHPQPGDSDPEAMEISRQLIINMDPPDHIKYRRVVRSAFTSKAVDALEPMMRDFSREIVDKVASRGECDFAAEVAAEMPLFVICALMGMPMEKRGKFSELVDTMIGMDDPELNVSLEAGQLAAAELFGIAMELAAAHQANPGDGTVIDALLNGVVEGEALNEFEFCTFFLILIAGAVETTRTATSRGMQLLIEHPEQHQLLIDQPALIEGAVEEILRFSPPFVFMQRTAMEDVTLGDMEIKAGDIVRLFYPSANREQAIFGDDVDSFDVTRAQRMPDLKNQHRTFGIGQHFCIGTHLARQELQIMFEEIIPRLRNPRMTGEQKNLVSNFVMGVKKMPIAFDKA
jgi:cytochrome P450